MSRSGAFLALAIILWAAVVLVGLVVRPPLPVDETRYLAVAWEMWQRGDFLVPYINGIPYHHKPPLLFWLMQAGWAAFGVSETAARLVAPLFALGSILLTAHLGRLLWPASPGVGPLAALILTGSALFAVFISLTIFDTLVTFFALLGWVGLVRAAHAARYGGSMARGWAIYAAALGLGVLSKGPVQALHVLPVALLAPLWMKDRSPGVALRWYAALALAVLGGAAIALTWAVPAALAGGQDFARKIFLDQHVGRMVESFQHGRPFWWYVPAAFAILFPWLCWISVWRRGVLGAVWREPGIRFCLCVIAPAFVVFSVISGKQPQYMLPLAAAACLVIARLLAIPACADRRFDRLPAILPIGACGLILLVAPLLTDHLSFLRLELILPGWLRAAVAACGLALIIGSITALRTGSIHRATAGLAALPVALLAALHVGMLAVRPAFDVGPAAAFLAQAEVQRTPVALLGDYEGQYHFAGRLTRPILEVDLATVQRWAAEHPDGLLITTPNSLPGDFVPAFTAPYRGRRVAIWHARDVIAQGGALLNR